MFCTHCGTQVQDGAKFCNNCGAPISANTIQQQPQSAPVPPQRKIIYQEELSSGRQTAEQQAASARVPSKFDQTWRLVSGIISLCLSAFVLFQSCAAGIVTAIDKAEGDLSASAGLFVALLMIPGGIVSIATRHSSGKGGSIAIAVLFALAALIGFSFQGVYKDLIVWAAWCAVCAGIAVFSLFEK